MDRSDTRDSLLADQALVEVLVPWPCPSAFGPQGRYTLEELIGAGRGSLVYRASDHHLSSEGFDAAAAIKIARSGASLHHDALSARRIAHPNVVSILDQGIADGAAYLVAEFVGGGDLGARHVPWPPRDAARFMAKVARGVHAAHSAGVVHCDLKPSNILLTADGEPKLGDFDLARWSTGPGGPGRGNVAFMSPEQFRSDPHALTPPSDIYALGGLLYYLLTGCLPNGATREEVTRTHATRAAPPSPGAQGDLNSICTRAMAPRREDRHHSGAAFADDLEAWLAFRPLEWTHPRAPRRLVLWSQRRPARAVLYTILLIASMTGLSFWQYHSVLEAAREVETQRQAVALANQQIAEISERVRAHIRSFMKLTFTSDATGIRDSMLPTLIWLQWLADSPVIRDERLPLAEERIVILRSLLHSAAARGAGAGPESVGNESGGSTGGADHLDTFLARYALAYFLVDGGDTQEAGPLVGALRAAWTSKLPPDDPFWTSLDTLDLCIEANAALVSPEPSVPLLRRLRDAEAALAQSGQNEPVRRIVARRLARLSAPPTPSTR